MISASGSRSTFFNNHFPRFTQSFLTLLRHLCVSPPPVLLRCNYCSQPLSSWHFLSLMSGTLVKTVRNLSKTETHTFIWKCRTINMWDEATRDQSLYRDPCHAAEAHGTYSHSSNDLIFSGSDLKNHKVNWRLSECQFMNYCFIMIDLCT